MSKPKQFDDSQALSDGEPAILSAIRTCAAPRWTLLMARLFGKRCISRDGCTRVVIAEWRGKRYLLDWSDHPQERGL